MTNSKNSLTTTIIVAWDFTEHNVSKPNIDNYSIELIVTENNNQKNFEKVKMNGINQCLYVLLHQPDFNKSNLDALIKMTNTENEVYILPFGGGGGPIYKHLIKIQDDNTRTFRENLTEEKLKASLKECISAYHTLPKLLEIFKIISLKRLNPSQESKNIIVDILNMDKFDDTVKAIKADLKTVQEIDIDMILNDKDEFNTDQASLNIILNHINSKVQEYGY